MSKLIISEPPLQVLPSLAVAIGLNEAIIVQQIHYWVVGKSGKVIDGQRWIYNGYREWKEQFPFWSEDTIQRAFRSAEKQGVIVSQHQKGFDRRKLYRIDYEALDNLILQSSITASCGNGQPQNADIRTPQDADIRTPQDAVMLTKTTETTTENGARKERAPRQVVSDEESALVTTFVELTHIPAPTPKTGRDYASAQELWYKPLRAIIAMANGSSKRVLEKAIAHSRQQNWNIACPKSLAKSAAHVWGENAERWGNAGKSNSNPYAALEDMLNGKDN